jgi:hypothetical protein
MKKFLLGRGRRILRACQLAVWPYVQRYPRLRSGIHRLRFNIGLVSVWVRALRYPQIDPHQTFWIDPTTVRFYGTFTYSKFSDRGGVAGGNWDQKRVSLAESDLYRAFEDRFIHGKAWESTDFYSRMLNLINKGDFRLRCRTESELKKKLTYYDALFESIKFGGYKAQDELPLHLRGPFKAEDEVSVRLDRNGMLLMEDGRHRLCLARLLAVDKIPVKITVRHREWWCFREMVIDQAKRNNGKVYQPICHPDLAHIPSLYDGARFRLIKPHLPIGSTRTLLDIGAHWGYFCHMAEETGLDCYAVESSPSTRYFLEKLRNAAGRRFTIIPESIFETNLFQYYDVVLALNIFHHFIKRKDSHEKLVALLKRLNAGTLFLQTHDPDDPQMRDAYRNYSPEEFVGFIKGNSRFCDAVQIGRTPNGRNLYRLRSRSSETGSSAT